MSDPGFAFESIFTLDARGNVIFDIFKSAFGMTDQDLFVEIQRNFSELMVLLSKKGISYADMKTALVPDAHKYERVYIFDWSAFESGAYGHEIHDCILPLLPKQSSRSVLVGDWVGNERFSEFLQYSMLVDSGEHVLVHHPVPETVHFVYINNLTRSMVDRIDAALSEHNAFVGAYDMRYMGPMKAALAHMLIKLYVQHRSIIVQPQEDDADINENGDLYGFGVERYGFRLRAIPQMLYQWFLSYKIECPALPHQDDDARISLNAITPVPVLLDELTVILDELKHKYLLENKEGTLKRVGMLEMTAEQIAGQIERKLRSNYIYNLAWTKEDETLKFNIMLEAPGPAKYLIGLKYLPADRQLRVLTMY